MEFFQIAQVATSAPALQQQVTLECLPDLCASIESVTEVNEDTGLVFCIWGRFLVRREQINGGVRFTMPDCPNAFQWTVTTGFPPAPQAIVCHGTVNRTEHDPDFIESMQDFFRDWKEGIEARLGSEPAPPKAFRGDILPMFPG